MDLNVESKSVIRERLLANKERSRIVRREHSFAAAYFPWSVIVDESTLKKALLYFDYVYLLAPEASLLDEFLERLNSPNRAPWMRSPAHFDSKLREKIIRFYARIKPLRDAGVIRTLDTNRMLADPGHRKTIEELSFADIVDFENAKVKTELPTVTTALDRSLMHILERRQEDVAFQYWDAALVQEIHPRIKERVDEYVGGLPPAVRPFLRSQIGDGSAAVTRALLLNSSLLCISDADVTPLTDDKPYFDLLRAKYQQIFNTESNAAAATNVKAMQEFVAKAATKAGVLADLILEIALPNIDYAELEDVLELREVFRDDLIAFRLSTMSLAASIKQSISDPEFLEECERIVLTNVIPQLQELQKKIRMSNLKLLRSFVNNALSLKPTVPFVISAFTPIPLYAAALVAAGMVTLDTALQAYIDRQDLLYNNGLAYLINVEKRNVAQPRIWSRSTALWDRFRV